MFLKDAMRFCAPNRFVRRNVLGARRAAADARVRSSFWTCGPEEKKKKKGPARSDLEDKEGEGEEEREGARKRLR